MSGDFSGPLGSLAADAGASEPEVRWRTAALMAEIPGDETETLLLRLMGDRDYRVRERSVAALSHRFSARVGEACLSALGDELNAGHRAAAVSLLTAAGRDGAKLLLKALESPSCDVRLAGAMSLPSADLGQDAVPALSSALEMEKDPNVRAGLLLALGRTRRREAVAYILPHLERGNVWTKVHAIEALGEVGDSDTSGVLLARVADPGLRRSALRALARLGTAKAADELARIADREGLDPDLVLALRSGLESATPETVALVRDLWPGASEALAAILADAHVAPAARCDAAHLLVRLDVRGACLEVLRAGPFLDGFACLGHLGRSRIEEALRAVLQCEDSEPALVLVERAVELEDASMLAPLLVHQSASVRAAVLNSLPPGVARLSDLIDILAEEDPETALPAALALATVAPGAPQDQGSAQKRALLDRAGGADGPGRVGALLALGGLDGADVDVALTGALGSRDPEVRIAAVRAAAGRRDFSGDVVKGCLADPAPAVRAAALRTIARWASNGRVPLPLEWRDCLVFLADEGPVPPAAGAAIVALAGPDRPRMAEELLAQGEAIRLAALEEIVRTGDAEAAEYVAIAATHEETETARAALLAQSVARPGPASIVASIALGDRRPAIRKAAAELIQLRGGAWGAGPVAAKLAKALAAEADPRVREALLKAVPAAADESAIGPVTRLLAEERSSPGAQEAADALAVRFEEAVRREWRTAPARAERRWAQALSAARRPSAIAERRPS